MSEKQAANFIRNIIKEDIKNHKNDGKVATRFPPEPNGYLHLGHVKSICLNFGMAEEFNGTCNLRFDDTNPEKENSEYMNAIKEDITWLGFEWEKLRHASDYFPELLEYAYQLIDQGDAYVDSQSAEEIRQNRGTLTEAGKNSPYRERSPEENRQLFDEMVAGKHPDGAHVLRAKINMASPNINMRDPVLYRIRHSEHFHAGKSWKVYPMYDYAHCLSDMIEGITHSLCTLEFEDHRPLYDWILNTLETPNHPQQIEFSRLNMEYTVLSKRWLAKLVQENIVDGWDDPRMPTIAGLRRRGIPAKALRLFCDKIGISKADGTIELSYFENTVREVLNQDAPRRMMVLNPVKLIITTLPEDYQENYHLPNHPQNPEMGEREVPFSREIYIEREDISENPPPKWKRLAPGQSVRLRGSYIITCTHINKNEHGEITEIHCQHDPNTLGKNPEGYKANGVIHWVSAKHARAVEVREYGSLFKDKNPMASGDLFDALNPEGSLTRHTDAYIEPNIDENAGTVYQMERLGYYALNTYSDDDKPILNLTVALREG